MPWDIAAQVRLLGQMSYYYKLVVQGFPYMIHSEELQPQYR
jgi:hypothetical protein